jgi:aconitate hydratase
MSPVNNNIFSISTLKLNSREYQYYPLAQLEDTYAIDLNQLPYSIRILLESAIRNYDGEIITEKSIAALAGWSSTTGDHGSISFMPARILLQDLTGVPLVVDLASLRSAAARAGKDPSQINPLIPVDLVIDHSIQVDFAGSSQALAQNTTLEYSRNRERYQFLKWAQNSIKNFRVIPPASGIVHQVNLEYLAQVAITSEKDGKVWVYPDSVFGTDSHTTMVNGLGVLGWGVGGIEAAAAMLGQPVETLKPDVVGVNITGQLKEGTSPTDIVLTLTEMLRKVGVVNKMVEFFGPGLENLTIPDRAMLANMAPEYGATAAYFPVDDAVLDYLRLTGRSEEHIRLTETYFKGQGLFRTKESQTPAYTLVVNLVLDSIVPSLAGPKRPQDRASLDETSKIFRAALAAPVSERGFALSPDQVDQKTALVVKGEDCELEHGSVVIAAITSCTNTSNPVAMISAGLLAKKAVELGLRSKPFVKTSLAPGSKAVIEYLEKADLVEPLEQLGFHLAGYGCTTCIGNSGPLDPAVNTAITLHNIVAAAVLSGNRNFEGRIHPSVQANYLASPALVVAYAIAGSIQNDLLKSPLGIMPNGSPAYLKDVWPSNCEVQDVVSKVITPDIYSNTYAHISDGDVLWKSINASSSVLYPWDRNSTYILETPFSDQLPDQNTIINRARILAIFGDSITTDHISPAGAITLNSPAADYLKEKGVLPNDFNTYGSRRGNHEVMKRGTFANIRIKNLMLPGVEGSITTHQPDNEKMTIFDAAMKYQQEGIDLVILAGKEYGSGSSRDWAAKGPLLLGVKAVIAESFERIHRSNLVGMGILPLQFVNGVNAASLGLDGTEEVSISGLDQLEPRKSIQVTAQKPEGSQKQFNVNVLFNSQVELRLWKNGGILRSFALR